MRFMLIHLSDIHITGQDDVINSRYSRIVDAVKNLDFSLDACVIITTGDIAYSGTDAQYLVAMEFLDNIKELLSTSLSGTTSEPLVPIYNFLVPGNHDCDFSESGEIRPLLIKSVLDDNSMSTAPDIVQACTVVQTAFFDFLTAMDEPQPEAERIASHQDFDISLCYEYRLTKGEDSIKFLCYNTAWLSQLHEAQGHLFFPAEAVVSGEHKANFVVAAFHHPYNWMEANAARQFRDRVESVADLVLTGHEHVASMRVQDGSLGQHNTCVEGGVLQENSDPDISEFNVFIFDTSLRQRKFGNFRWHEDKYQLTEKSSLGDEGSGLGWTDYRVNDLRPFRRFQLSADMQQSLDDPGIDLRHRDKGTLKLRDVFLYPDLVEISDSRERFGQRVAGEGVRDLLGPNAKLLITGDTESGKSCLAKILFLDLLENGVVPIFLDSTRKPPSGDRLYGFIEEVFSEQYGPKLTNDYTQLDKSDRAIIIDDFHKLQLNSLQKKDLLKRLSAFANRLVVFSHDISSDLEEIADPSRLPEGLGEIAHYRIQPFGFAGRNKLAQRWMLLGEGVDPRDITFIRNLDRINETLNTLVGKNYVPSYPVYVLSVLQALDTSTPVDFTASTHGYFYELFIKTSLARGRSNIDFDIIASYLAFLAYQLWTKKSTVISDIEFRTIHESYETHYAIRRSYESFKRQLLAQNILVSLNGSIRFKYSYLYNYFVASYLRDHITDPRILATVTDICRAVHVESNSNILLFLAHLSKDPVVIEELLSASEDLYSDHRPADLQDDIIFLTDLGLTLPDTTYEETDPQANREEILAEIDRTNPPNDGGIDLPLDEDEADIDMDDPLVKFVTALRQLEILGQVLKNFPGSLEGTVKLRIARECYRLGLRSLSVAFGTIKSEQMEILKLMAKLIRERHPNFTQTEVDSRARETLIGLAHALSYSMIKRTAISVSSRDLTRTFEWLLEESPTPAYKLINSALELDNQTDFPIQSINLVASDFEVSPLPLSVLRQLVVTHFQLFPVDFKIKQSVCDTLGIKYATLQRGHPSPRMLPRATSGTRVN